MMSTTIVRHHAEWLSLLEISGPFLSMPVLLRAFPQGLPAHDSQQFAGLRLAFEEWQANREAEGPDVAIHRAWLHFVPRELLGLGDEVWREGQALPPGLEARLEQQGETLRPDAAVVNPDGTPEAGKPRLLVQFYPPEQGLERAVEGRFWKASPATRLTELLHATGVPLGLATNGERWMLVVAPAGETSGYISWYAPLWLEEPVTWRAFAELLGAARWLGVADGDTLEALLRESAGDQQEVTDQLGYQVRRAVEVLVQTLDRIDRERGRTLLTGVAERDIYQAALTIMMRLVFLFSAEERGLLLLGDPLYDESYAVSTLRGQLQEAADEHGEEVLEYRRDAWSRLLATFRAVYGGVQHDRMPLPAYGGRLFDPDRFPFLEGRAAGTRWQETAAQPLPIDNRTVLHLLRALQMLEVKVPGGGQAEARRLSFRALDIEQIGHVYEGLLDHTAKRAVGPVLSLRGTKYDEPEIELCRLEEMRDKGGSALLDELKEQTGRSTASLQRALAAAPEIAGVDRLRRACDNDEALLARVLPFAGLVRDDTFEMPVVIGAGSLYVTQGSDRRSSGTHYTPRVLTEPLVQRTLDPLVYAGFADGVAASPDTLRPPRELLQLKVCDPACGSAGVLVQACRYLAEKLVEAWAKVEQSHPGRVVVSPEGELSTGAPEERPLPQESEERLALARRLVADRCLYGVDKDPMAVEMAKLSLWLVTLQKGRPFTFLDHAIRCGDSLLGVDTPQLRTWSLDRRGTSTLDLFVRQRIKEAIELRREIERHQELDIHDVRHKAQLLEQAEAAMQRAKLAADLIIAPSLHFAKVREQVEERERLQAWFIALKTEENEANLRERAGAYLEGHTPFHWPLEFPEVFFDEEDNDRGFDAIIGNPPFVGGQRITGMLGVPYREYLIEALAGGRKGSADLVAYFYLRAFGLLRKGGSFGLIATNTIAQGDTREVGLDQIALDGGVIYAAHPSQKWPGTANLEVAICHIHRGDWNDGYLLAEQSVTMITPFLTPPGKVTGNPHRLAANANKSFQGSIVLGMGFVLTPEEAQELIARDPRNKDVLFPYLNGEDLNSRPDQSPSRWCIQFDERDQEEATQYSAVWSIAESRIKPDRMTRDSQKYPRMVHEWWKHWNNRQELAQAMRPLNRVIVRARVSNLNSMAFAGPGTVFSDQIIVFALERDADFAILQSLAHTLWLTKYASSMRTDVRYSISDCFETFPLPSLHPDQQRNLEMVGSDYYKCRQRICLDRHLGLTKVYNLFHSRREASEDIVELRALQVLLDQAVISAYGWTDLELKYDFYEVAQTIRFLPNPMVSGEILDRLLALNHARHSEEAAMASRYPSRKRATRSRERQGQKLPTLIDI
jgi:hypothetical protein